MESIREYVESQQLRRRKFVMHAGVNDVLKGSSYGVVDLVRWKLQNFEDPVAICSIPEVSNRGRLKAAEINVLNERQRAAET